MLLLRQHKDQIGLTTSSDIALILKPIGRALELARPYIELIRVVGTLLPFGAFEQSACIADDLAAAAKELLERHVDIDARRRRLGGFVVYGDHARLVLGLELHTRLIVRLPCRRLR